MDKRFEFFNIPYKELKAMQEGLHPFDHVATIVCERFEDMYKQFYKKDIVKIAQWYGLRLSMRLTKANMLERLKEHLANPQKIRKQLLYVSDLCYETLRKKVFNKQSDYRLNADEWYGLSALFDLGMCESTPSQDFVFDTLRLSIIKQVIYEPGFNEKRQKYSFLRGLLDYVQMVYAIIDEDHIYSLYRQKFPVTKEEFFTLYHNMEYQAMIYHEDTHEFISCDLDQDDIDYVRDLHRSQVISLVNIHDIEDYINYGYPQDEHYDYLRWYLMTVLDEGPLSVLDHVRSLFLSVAASQDLVDYMEEFALNFNYPENKKIGVILLCICLRVLECYAYTRCFDLYGATVIDILKSNPTVVYTFSINDERVKRFVLAYREEFKAAGFEVTDEPRVSMKIQTFESDEDDQDFDLSSYKMLN